MGRIVKVKVEIEVQYDAESNSVGPYFIESTLKRNISAAAGYGLFDLKDDRVELKHWDCKADAGEAFEL